jgi:hypothetical protein
MMHRVSGKAPMTCKAVLMDLLKGANYSRYMQDFPRRNRGMAEACP